MTLTIHHSPLSLSPMKKWLAILLIMITAAGTFLPCCSEPETESQANHQNKGACSPFFACATCPGSVELAKTIQLPSPVIEKIVHHQTTISLRLPHYAASYWQPPRLC
jgi:hypothetical protein